MTTKQDVFTARDNYLRAASELQDILRKLDSIIENGKRGVLVVASSVEAAPDHPLTDRMTA
jgi:hypothetical protein